MSPEIQLSIPMFVQYTQFSCRGQAKAGETVLVHGASGGVCRILHYIFSIFNKWLVSYNDSENVIDRCAMCICILYSQFKWVSNCDCTGWHRSHAAREASRPHGDRHRWLPGGHWAREGHRCRRLCVQSQRSYVHGADKSVIYLNNIVLSCRAEISRITNTN